MKNAAKGGVELARETALAARDLKEALDDITGGMNLKELLKSGVRSVSAFDIGRRLDTIGFPLGQPGMVLDKSRYRMVDSTLGARAARIWGRLVSTWYV